MPMKSQLLEELYPIDFRAEDSEKLAALLENQRSVVLVGMKRVGISNFLRFFLNNKSALNKYLKDSSKNIFITVDLNDLVERELFPFWILTFKRISDYVDENIENKDIKKRVSQLFLDSIQSQDLFLTIDGIRKTLKLLSDNEYSPTIFFNRFDRIIDAATHSFFSNFQGLIDAADRKLTFVFTSMRPLDSLSAEVFTKHALSVFADTLYIKPAKKTDTEIIYSITSKEYGVTLSKDLQDELLKLVDGYNQYLQFALIALSEQIILSSAELLKTLAADERILLQSEELWESLNTAEQEILEKIVLSEKILPEDIEKGDYLFKTGIITGKNKIFSPLFEGFILERTVTKKKDTHPSDFSKKEHLLLTYLEERKNDICEREEIIEAVWKEAEALGVSDWAIDRLVARLRAKLKLQKSPYEIITIKTRGYKLIETE